MAEVSDDNGVEVSINDQIKASLGDLGATEKQVHDLLISRVDESFFEIRKTPKPLKELAAEILSSIDWRQNSNED